MRYSQRRPSIVSSSNRFRPRGTHGNQVPEGDVLSCGILVDCDRTIEYASRIGRDIADTITQNPELVDVYRSTIAPEESFFSTILVNALGLRVLNVDLHYEDWSTIRTGSPRSLSVQDLRAIERSGKWFARKIDPRADDGLRDALDALRVRIRGTGDASDVAAETEGCDPKLTLIGGTLEQSNDYRAPDYE
jgi:hypothetical protein